MKAVVFAKAFALAAALGVLGAVSSGAALAQESNAALFQRLLQPGDHVRLGAPGVQIADAQVLRVTADSLAVAQGGQQWQLRSVVVQRLDVRRSNTRRWGVRGAIGGAFFGMIANSFISELCTGCGTSRLGAGLQGALAFGLAGAALGTRNFRWVPIVE